MRLACFCLFLSIFASVTLSFAQQTAGKLAIKKKAGTTSPAAAKTGTASRTSAPGRNSPAPRSAAASRTTSPARRGVTAKKTTRRGAPSAARQAAPTPERYKEIQEALASKGYLKSEPSGVWDAESAEAMRQFQTDRKLDPSGKLTAAALIDLGLGPKNGTMRPVAAAATDGAAPESPRIETAPAPQP